MTGNKDPLPSIRECLTYGKSRNVVNGQDRDTHAGAAPGPN